MMPSSIAFSVPNPSLPLSLFPPSLALTLWQCYSAWTPACVCVCVCLCQVFIQLSAVGYCLPLHVSPLVRSVQWLSGQQLLHGALLYMVTNIELTSLFIIFLSKTVLPPKRYAMLIIPCTVDVCTLPVANREHYSRAFTSALIAEKRNHRGKKRHNTLNWKRWTTAIL